MFVKQKSEQKGSKKVSTISTTLRVVSETAGAPTHTIKCANRASPFASVRSPNAHILEPQIPETNLPHPWMGAWRDVVMGKDERRKFSRGFTWSGRCGSLTGRQPSARRSGWRVRGWRQGWLPRRQRLHVNPLSENFRGVTNQLRPLWRFSDCVRRKLSPEKITM